MTSVIVEGTGFAADATVTVGGESATCDGAGAPTLLVCDVPAGPLGRATVVVTNPDLSATTLIDGWTWTASANETDSAAEADYCVLQFPPTVTVTVNNPSELIFGRIYEAGVTDGALGPAPGVLAELGYGPLGADPTTTTGWLFAAALFNVEAGNDDEYMGTITVPAAGTYAYAWRFSLDGGVSFTYCDANGAGSNGGLTFEPNQLGTLTAQ